MLSSPLTLGLVTVYPENIYETSWNGLAISKSEISVFLHSLSRLLMMHITFWIHVYSVMKLFSFYSILGERLSGLRGDLFLITFTQHVPSFSPFSKVGFPPVPSLELFLSLKKFPVDRSSTYTLRSPKFTATLSLMLLLCFRLTKNLHVKVP